MKKNSSKKKGQIKKRSRAKSPGSTRLVLLVTIAVIAVIAIGATGLYFAYREPRYDVSYPDGRVERVTLSEMKKYLDVDTFYQGITINGIDVSGMTKEEVQMLFADNPEHDHQEITIRLDVKGQLYPLDFSGETLESNLNDVIKEAYEYARVGEGQTETEQYVDRYQKLIALKQQPIRFETAFTLERDIIERIVRSVLDPLIKEVKDAQAIDFDVEELEFVIEESKEGFQVDVITAIEDVKRTLDSSIYDATIEVGAYVEYPEITKEMLEDSMGLISSTSSSTTNDPPRNTNIRLICEAIDGHMLMPGESFNFNDHVGQRTAEKGYQEAGGIYDGILRQELGGGICQPNTMIFHSVVKADLQVDMRSPHSWPSTYVETGTDATVTWGGANFQFTNNSDFPIAIHAYYENRRVTVEIYGHQLPDGMTIEFVGEVNSVTPSTGVDYVADKEMPVGETEVEREPRDAISATAYKVYYDSDGNELYRERAFSSFYPMIRARVLVGVLNEDGTFSEMDKETGEVITPEPTEEPTPEPTPEPVPGDDGDNGNQGSEPDD